MKKFSLHFNEERQGKFYSEVIEKGILQAIKRLYKQKARFITATCFQNTDEFFIFYHFELGKKIYTLKTKLKDAKAESIASVYPTAAWIEREMADLYGIEFEGLKNKKPLILSPEYNHPFKDE